MDAKTSLDQSETRAYQAAGKSRMKTPIKRTCRPDFKRTARDPGVDLAGARPDDFVR
jgi:hypothetical protein